MVKVVYGCVTNSLERVQRYVLPRVGDRELTLLWNQTSMSYAYNRVLDSYETNPPDALILVHDDLEITDPDAEAKFLDALGRPDVGIVGVAGGYEVTGLAWWNARTRGYQMIDSGPLVFDSPCGYVQSLEGSVMVFGHWAITHLRFDEAFTGFHGYDHIGTETLTHGKRVYVTNVVTHHHTSLGFKSQASAVEWARADELFRQRYGGVLRDTAQDV